MTIQVRPFARLTIGDLDELVPEAGTAGIDAVRVPYAVSEVTIPLTSRDLGEAIDPHDELRGTLVGGDDATGASRTFDLSVRSREIDHVARKIRVRMESDESLLQAWAPLADDATPRTHEASARAFVNYVLGQVIPGAALEPGDADADLTAYWMVSNLIVNPSFEVDGSGWINAVNADIVVPNDTKAFMGTKCGHWRQFSAGGSWIESAKMRVQPGRSYVASAYLSLILGAAGTGNVAIRFYAGDTPMLTYNGTSVAVSTSGWTRATHNVVAPPGATHALVAIVNNGGADRYPAVDAVMFYEGTEIIPAFDGSTPDGATYTYDWESGANSSPSTRRPVIERTPDVFTWKAGDSAWEFLEPLTSAAGLRLFCDENRKWRLVDHATYTTPGRLTIAGFNAYRGTDIVNISDTGDACKGVVIRYRWDDAGITREMVDAAGTPGSVYSLTLDRPYPGPGAAAAILASRAGRGREQDVTALSNWAATPSMEASISLPATVEQIGRLTSVEWELKSPLMRIGTSGLTDAAPGTWLAWDPEQAWQEVDPDLTWEEA